MVDHFRLPSQNIHSDRQRSKNTVEIHLAVIHLLASQRRPEIVHRCQLNDADIEPQLPYLLNDEER